MSASRRGSRTHGLKERRRPVSSAGSLRFPMSPPPRHLLLIAVAASTGLLHSGPIDYQSQVRPVLEAHCFRCHGEEKQKGELRIDTLSAELLEDRRAAETWHDVLDALNRGDMPPDDEPEQDREDRLILVGWINQEIDALLEAEKSTGGRVVLRRMNRA